MKRITKNEQGITLIEIFLLIVIVVILGTVVLSTYGGVQAKNRNSSRQANINLLQRQLETYFAQFSHYPSIKNLNDPSWRQKNLPNLPENITRDPRWNAKNTNCTSDKQAIFSASPAKNCYSYEVGATDGASCLATPENCAQYTLTATLEGGGKYVKTSLN